MDHLSNLRNFWKVGRFRTDSSFRVQTIKILVNWLPRVGLANRQSMANSVRISANITRCWGGLSQKGKPYMDHESKLWVPGGAEEQGKRGCMEELNSAWKWETISVYLSLHRTLPTMRTLDLQRTQGHRQLGNSN